jgi:hypothetical protein
MADIENRGTNDDDGLRVTVAERSEFTRITAMCIVVFLSFGLLAISALLIILFQYAYPGTKLAVVALVAGTIGIGVVMTCDCLLLRLMDNYYDVENPKQRGRLIDRFIQFHVDFFKVIVC